MTKKMKISQERGVNKMKKRTYINKLKQNCKNAERGKRVGKEVARGKP